MRFILLAILIMSSISAISQCNGFPFWLEGTWGIENSEGKSFEEWKLKNDTVLIGRNYRLFANDTIEFETMEISCLKNYPVYFMNASMNNMRVRAGYIPVQITNNVWLWQNEHTDFPSQISYNKINDTSVMVWFKGTNPNEECVDLLMIKKQ